MYDIAVIGAGPAGVSAVINAMALNKSCLWISGAQKSDKVMRAELIKNYPAIPSITGEDFANALYDHAIGMGATLTEGVATAVYNMETHFIIAVKEQTYDAKCVILALGVATKKPLENEEDFVGRGVSYCATCDGFLYKNKDIAVLITDKKYEHEVEFLSGVANKVYLLATYNDCSVSGENITRVNSIPVGVKGRMRLEQVVLKDGEIAVDGLFVLRDSVSPKTLLSGLEIKDGKIVVDRDMKTSVKGVFACGDCTGAPYQYAKAVGEGNVALHSAIKYLATAKD